MQQLLELSRAFQGSRVLLSAVELDLFTAVGEGATADEAARKAGAVARATEMLLNAAVSLGLLTRDGEVFRNTADTARYLVEGAPDDSRAALMHTVHLWENWSTLTECVRQGKAVRNAPIADRGDRWTTAFIAAMHRNATGRAAAVVSAVGGARRMIDIGGGSGAYSIAFAQANPELRAEILDLPTVLPIARGRIEEAGLSHRITTRAGDLRKDSFGGSYDLVFLSAICHMLSEDENRDLIRRCFAATAPGGRIVIQDFLLDPGRTAPTWATLFALNMLVGTDHGNCYTEAEYASWLGEAGCAEATRVNLSGPAHLMIGRRA